MYRFSSADHSLLLFISGKTGRSFPSRSSFLRQKPSSAALFHISDYLDLTPSDYVVVMTNGHTHDFDVLRQVLQNPPAYVGVIGSRRKTAFVNQKLLECGIEKDVLSRVHAPIGTAIKAVTPEEIAVSHCRGNDL